MSDEDRDVDIESDIDDDDQISIDGMGSGSGSGSGINIPDGTQFMTQAEKRAHHNALERKRRDHIKESFSSLRDSVPALHGEKVRPKVSRAQILKKASDYIQYMRKKNHSHQSDIDDLKRQNYLLDSQVRALEKAKSTGQFANQASTTGNPTPAVNPKGGAVSAFDGGSDSESSESIDASKSKRKKLKTSPK